MDDRKCETCRWWQDYKIRVWATISATRGDRARNTMELRMCKYSPAPTVRDVQEAYTDSEYSCSNWAVAQDGHLPPCASKPAVSPTPALNSAMVPCPHWLCLDDCVWQDEKSGAKVMCSDAGPCVFRARHQ